jgi:lipid II:glycine glycyltransferase (peptidoglycan interpeptide bridge formation enzyme)
LSAALIIFYNYQAIYHHSASIEQKIPVNYLLQWEIIKEAKKRGKKIYNMWGICPEDKRRHPWKGLTLFKKGFGGRIVEYLHAQDYPLSSFYCTTYIIECLRKYIKGY